MNKFYNFLGLAKRSNNVIEGYSKCNEQRNKRDLFLFIITREASDKSRSKFVKHCEFKNIPCIQDFSKEELGSAIGREEIKILAIADESMAKKLISLYEEEKASN